MVRADNKLVMDLWKDYCRDYRDVEELQFPYSPGPDLYDLESYYKMLDLYFQFSRKVGGCQCPYHNSSIPKG